jgi:3-methyladenine DNA glycosylase AlkD
VTNPRDIADRIAADVEALPVRSIPAMRRARRRWSTALRASPAEELLAIANALTETGTPRFVAFELVLHHKGALALTDRTVAERLAGSLATWRDVDEFATLIAGPAWLTGRLADATISEWAASGSRWWRRAALVATTGLNVPSRGGRGDTARTLAVCEQLVQDRDDMVVKALSWALRELARHDPASVAAFAEAQAAYIAPRVRREVANKLTTGLKNGRPTR